MRNTSIAMMLAVAVVPRPSFAKTHDCPGFDHVKRVDAKDQEGTIFLEVDTLFKCHSDAESFDGALAGLAGDLNGHSRRAFGIVTFGDDGYFAFVRAPYRVSAPVFFVRDDTSYACVTVQHSKNACADKQKTDEAVVEIDVEVDVDMEVETSDVAPPEDISQWPSRLLQANFDADGDVATQQEDERDGYRKPQAPPLSNTPAGLPEAKDIDPKDLPMQAGNIGLREPKAPPLQNQPAGLPEGKDMDIEEFPMQAGNIGLREPKAPPLENQPAGLPEAKDIDAEDLPMQAGNIGLREPQAPDASNQAPAQSDDGDTRQSAQDQDS